VIGRLSAAAALGALVAAQPALAHSGEAPVFRLGSAWDPAPVVALGAGIALLLFMQAFVRLRRRGRADHADWSRPVLFLLAMAIGTLALVSPLDAVGDSYLLSGHMLQHVLIGDAAPALALVALRGPLLFFLLPYPLLRSLARLPWLRRLLALLLRPSVSLAIWVVVIAAWHVPAAYDYALRHQTVHDLEHLSFILAGLLVWMQIIDPARRRRLRLSQRFGYMVALAAGGAVLADVLILSPGPLYPAYAAQDERLFGISPFRDQQWAGVVMIVEQLASLGLCAGFLLHAHLRPARARERGAITGFGDRAAAKRGRPASAGGMPLSCWLTARRQRRTPAASAPPRGRPA
jgi:cytochrome c oxidase assembly factor CtaG